MEITLKFTVEEVAAILNALSAMPTGAGVWPLAVRIKAETEAQIPKEEPKEEVPANETVQ